MLLKNIKNMIKDKLIEKLLIISRLTNIPYEELKLRYLS